MKDGGMRRASPVVVDRDPLRGTDIIDVDATRAAQLRASQRSGINQPSKHDPEALLAKQMKVIEQARADRLAAEREAPEVPIDMSERQVKSAAETRRRKQAEMQAEKMGGATITLSAEDVPDGGAGAASTPPDGPTLNDLLKQEQVQLDAGDAVALEAIRAKIEKVMMA